MWKFSIVLFALVTCAPKQGEGNTQENTDPIKVNVASEPLSETIVANPADTTYHSYGFNMLMGHFDPAKHKDYVVVEAKYADRSGMYIHKDTYNAFLLMREAARLDSVNLVIRSATRNFDYQKGIWERKWEKESAIKDPVTRALKILEYSSMPGTSRHHWGSDIDLNNFNNSWFEKGEGLRMWNWLEEHAAEFGFCRPYTAKDELRPNGYQEERWHWSYMPLSKYFMSMAKEKHSDSEINGFKGAEVADEINVVENYVMGVNKQCIDN
ncbi:M15 family metallopeptidase [Portibacter lacus]|uniref:D-alanyl-D-alanine carboxypeptidase-like core domain-containing protein n=1 Tax=Portibacter lacus TaxID=1099794 RepID=A0AA37SNM4_9BACT|nr:M15 family metallopeptidase [Portibacter lacus]GLR17881.1 hypothetical protein GCM10007940_24960 [Portibacter lacus]